MAALRNTISGLDINRSNICYARCIPEDRLIANICIQPIEIDSGNYWEAVTNGFAEFLKELNIPGEKIVASLGGENAIIKKIAIDNDEADIDDAIQWELSQQIIGSIEEYVYDYQLITNTPEGNYQNFLVVGYREIMVDRVAKLLKAKKLNPVIIDIDIFALINTLEINYKGKITEPSVIIFSDLHSTKVILTLHGMFIDLEILNHDDDMMNPDVFIQIVNEVITLLFRCNPIFLKADKVYKYLTGVLFSQSEFTNSVLNAIPDSEMLYPFRKISCSAGMDDEKLREFAPQLAVSVGLTVRDID